MSLLKRWKIVLLTMLAVVIILPISACSKSALPDSGNSLPPSTIIDDNTDPNDNGQIIDDGEEDPDDSQPVDTEPSQPEPPKVTETFYTNKAAVTLVNLNMRTAPSSSATVVTTLAKGTTAQLISVLSSGWYKIKYNGTERYISSSPSYTAVIDNNDYRVIADRVIAEGTKLLGRPYDFGAPRLFMWNGKINPEFTGKTFDCSSFMQYIYYYGANVRLDADSRSQSKQGKEVAKKDMRKGDLLFMYSTARRNNTGIERIGHVAMYIGNNQILHTFGTGGVRIQDYSSFWAERTLKVMRVF